MLRRPRDGPLGQDMAARDLWLPGRDVLQLLRAESARSVQGPSAAADLEGELQRANRFVIRPDEMPAFGLKLHQSTWDALAHMQLRVGDYVLAKNAVFLAQRSTATLVMRCKRACLSHGKGTLYAPLVPPPPPRRPMSGPASSSKPVLKQKPREQQHGKFASHAVPDVQATSTGERVVQRHNAKAAQLDSDDPLYAVFGLRCQDCTMSRPGALAGPSGAARGPLHLPSAPIMTPLSTFARVPSPP